MRCILICLLFCFLSLPVTLHAQTGEDGYFEGTIDFKVEFKGPVAEQIRVNEPNTRMQMHIKDGSYIINLSGGRSPKTFLYSNKHDWEFSIDFPNKAAYKYSAHQDLNRKNKVVPEAVYTGKTAEVNGILCDIYRMEKEGVQFLFYVNDAYRVNMLKYEGKKRAKPSFLIKGLDGRIPLRTAKKQEGLIVITVASKISPVSFSEEQFLVPKDFELKNRDYRP